MKSTNNESSASAPAELHLFRLAWPMMVEMLLFILLGFVDVLVLSRYDDLAASGINTANQAVSVLTIVFTVFSSAGGILITQYLGAGQRQAASRIAALSIALHLFTGLAVSIVLVLFSQPILCFIGAKGQVLSFSQDYLSVVGGFIFLQAVLNALSGIFRSHGMTKLPMFVTAGMNVLNTLLDVLLVPGWLGFPKMGVMGAAVATVITRALGVIVLMVLLFRKVEKPSLFRWLKPFPKRDLALFFRFGVPAALETFLYNLSQLVITSIVLNCLTEQELIAKRHRVGAGAFTEARQQGFHAYKTALLIAMISSVIGILLRVPLISIFTDNAGVIQLASGIFILNLFLEFGRTTNLVLIACLRGAGDVFYPTACAVFSNWLLSVGGSYVLAVVCGWGLYGLWIALAADECFRGLLMILRWCGTRWQNARLGQTAPSEEASDEAFPEN